jgi:hypothetical protein
MRNRVGTMSFIRTKVATTRPDFFHFNSDMPSRSNDAVVGAILLGGRALTVAWAAVLCWLVLYAVANVF